MFTQAELETKSGPELVKIFNSIDGVSPVRRFRTRETGVQRIMGYTSVEDIPAPKALTLEPAKQKVRTKERGVYNLEPKELIRTFRANSRRGRLINLLLGDGATFDELLANTDVGFPKEDVLHKTLRILNWWTGYGLTTDENGTIRLTS